MQAILDSVKAQPAQCKVFVQIRVAVAAAVVLGSSRERSTQRTVHAGWMLRGLALVWLAYINKRNWPGELSYGPAAPSGVGRLSLSRFLGHSRACGAATRRCQQRTYKQGEITRQKTCDVEATKRTAPGPSTPGSSTRGLRMRASPAASGLRRRESIAPGRDSPRRGASR